jgi:hypothetical protein
MAPLAGLSRRAVCANCALGPPLRTARAAQLAGNCAVRAACRLFAAPRTFGKRSPKNRLFPSTPNLPRLMPFQGPFPALYAVTAEESAANA